MYLILEFSSYLDISPLLISGEPQLSVVRKAEVHMPAVLELTQVLGTDCCENKGSAK